MKRMAVGLCAIGVAVSMLLPAGVAQASFEGRNGKIAFGRTGGDKQGVWRMRPDGSRITRLSRGNDSFPVWSPDGSSVAFLRWTGDYSSSRIMVMNKDGSNKRRIGTASIGQGCALQPPRWSYDGLFLLYVDDCFDRDPRVSQLRVASAVSGAELELTDYSSQNGISDQPWSPNLEESQRITFTSDRDGDLDVYVMNSDGSEEAQLTTDSDDQFEAIWSPAGDRIAYSTQVIQQSGAAQSTIDAIDPNGTGETTLVTGAPLVTEPIWSPDGTRIAVTRRTRMGQPTAIVVDASGGNEVTLGKDFQTADAAWAPDSSALVFAAGEVIRFKLTATGVTKKVLTSSQAYETGVDWQALPN